MIVSFSLSNYRSFREEETLSLVASNRLGGPDDGHTMPIPGSRENVLKTAILYGANGAGKSNVFKALRYLESVALEVKDRKTSKGTGRTAFFGPDNSKEPSTFDLQFIAENKLYRYGVALDDSQVIDEWLFIVTGARQRAIYTRSITKSGEVVVDVSGAKSASAKVSALAKVGAPSNQSFLASLHAMIEPEDLGKELKPVVDWFRGNLQLIGPDESYLSLGHLLTEDSDFLKFSGDLLRSCSTGVARLETEKKEMSEAQLRSFLPGELVSKVIRDLEDDGGTTAVIRSGQGHEVLIERKGDRHYYQISVRAAHELEHGTVVSLDLSEESDGTIRLLNLLPALHHMKRAGAVYFIDEIDRSLHPILVREFLGYFLRSCDPGMRQIIVTTHESSLLDQDLARRDEIWFVEKDRNGASRLYSLLDFKVRNDLQIRKHYLQGRFGAIPFLGQLSRLELSGK